MNTWTPLWSSTLDSTLWEEPPHVRLLFFTLLMMRDPDHVVRAALRVISKRANLDKDGERAYGLAEEAMNILEAPDRKSREYQEHEGRRVKKVEDGWLVLNGEKYLEQMKGLAARVRKTQKQKQRRDQERVLREARPLPGERIGEQPHEWRTGPGGDLENPPVETVTNSPATGTQSRSVPPRGSSSSRARASPLASVQSTAPPADARTAVPIDNESSDALASNDPNSEDSNPTPPSTSRSLRGVPVVPKPSRVPSPPSPEAARVLSPVVTPKTGGVPTPAVSRPDANAARFSQSGGAVRPPPGARAATANAPARSAAQVLSGIALPRPITPPSPSVVQPVSSARSAPPNNTPRPAPVDPRKVDTLPRDAAGMVAGTGAGSMFSDWGERTIAKPGAKPAPPSNPRAPAPPPPSALAPPDSSLEDSQAELERLSEEPPVD